MGTATFETLADFSRHRADMRVQCKCGRTINIPAGEVFTRFGSLGRVEGEVHRLKCRQCGRRGHASVTAVPSVQR